MKPTPLLTLLLASTALAQSTSPSSPASRYDAAFLSGDTQLLWDNATPELRKAIGSPKDLTTLRTTLLGDHPEPLDLQTDPSPTNTTLLRTVKGAADQKLTITYVVNNKTAKLTGLLIQPATAPKKEAPTAFLDYQTKATLRLPFSETWTVAWGGRSVRQNYHAAYPDQRFAYDLLIVKDHSTHTGDGTRLEDYHCFDQPILSPAAATVLSAVSDLPDLPPGQMDRKNAMGNHVVLDLGNNEYLFLCHFKQHSLKVKPGDKVTPGQELARCGNSGNTSEPHLHLHLQTTPTPFRGKGLPTQFQNYTADTHPTPRGEPTRNQQIRPQDPE